MMSNIILAFYFLGILTSCEMNGTKSIKGTEYKTVEIAEVGLAFTYPAGDIVPRRKSKYHMPGRAGAVVSVDINNRYGDLILQEVLFHTFESCSTFAIHYEDITGEGYPERWYSPDFLIKHKAAFENDTKLPGYSAIKTKEHKFLNLCMYNEPGGIYGHDSITFVDNTRIIIFLTSEIGCKIVEEKVSGLLNQIILMLLLVGKCWEQPLPLLYSFQCT